MLRPRRVAEQPRPGPPDVYTQLGRAQADLAATRHQLAATRARLSDEQALTGRLRLVLALARFSGRGVGLP